MSMIQHAATKRYAPISEPLEFVPNLPGEIVGTISEKHSVVWTVSPHRADKRHGSIESPKPMSNYWQSMYEAISIR